MVKPGTGAGPAGIVVPPSSAWPVLPGIVGLFSRQLCLRRWSSCKASQMTLGTQTWKQYYLCRAELEFRMECGRPEKDFICKAIAGHEGMAVSFPLLTCLGRARWDVVFSQRGKGLLDEHLPCWVRDLA